MGVVRFELPEGIEGTLNMQGGELTRQFRFMAALKLFELGKRTGGEAAEAAGLTRRDFLDLAADHGVSAWNLEPAEVAEELRREARKNGAR